MKTAETLVERVSDAFSLDWDKGTEENAMLAQRLTALIPVINNIQENEQADVLTVYIEAVMHLDTDDDGRDRLRGIIEKYLNGE